jgi:hypothetical protein
MPADNDDDEDERDEDLDGEGEDDEETEGDEDGEGEEDEGDGEESNDEDEDDDEGADEVMYVALERDTTILIVYVDLDTNLEAGTTLAFSARGIWRMDADGNVQLLDGLRDGVALPVEEMSNYCGIIDRVPGEAPEQTKLRAMGELAERIKLVLQRKARS